MTTGHVLAEDAMGLPPLDEAVDAGDIVATPVAPAAALPPRARLRALLPVAVVLSLALHAAAAATLLLSARALPEYGVLKNETDATSLETAQSIVLESTMSEPVEAAAASAAAMPEGSVEQIDADPVPVKEIEDLPVKDAAAPASIKTANVDPNATQADTEPLEVLSGSAEPVEAVPAKAAKEKVDPKKSRREKTPDKVRHERTKRQNAGGTTSRSNAAKGKGSGRASASRGSILSYAARVRAKVSRNKPSGGGHRGTARVSFAVSSSGGLSYARLASSSGNAALDRAALSAVRRAAPFGAPPAGASAGQLRFSIPFYFR